MNSTCTWSDSPPAPLDLTRSHDRDHLRVDVQIAGELAVRFADATNRSVAALNRPLRERCRGAMYDSIMQRHSVSAADLARAELARVWWVDFLLVTLPMAVVTVVAMDRVTRRVFRSFDSDSRTIATISASVLAPIVAAISVGVAQFWAFGVETMLLRNEHLSFRAFQIPVMLHGWIAFIIALTLCAATMILRLRYQRGRPNEVRVPLRPWQRLT